MFKNNKLLDSSDDEELAVERPNNSSNHFKINTGYAQNYDRWRSSEEAQKLKDRYGADVLEDDSESSSSDDSGLDDEEKEKEFLKTLSLVKKKDERIYDGKSRFFEDIHNANGVTAASQSDSSKKSSKKDSKPFLLKDHEREMLLKRQTGNLSADEDEEIEQNNKMKQGLPYNQELRSIKKEFSDVLEKMDSDEEDSGSLLRKRTVTDAEKEKDDKDYRLWLKGQLEQLDGKSKKEMKEVEYLRDFWNDPELPEDEKFLKDYVLNRRYIDPDKTKAAEYIPTYDEIVHDSDEGGLSGDENFENQREEFEHKYNFRFEEPDQEFIKRYPRTVADSLRRSEEKRKKQRELKKEAKQSKLEKKRDEVQRLKSIKRTEIMEKLQKLQEITGDPNLAISEMDIEEDFDPEEHDCRMNQLFNENYYGNPEEEKPTFPSDEELDEVNWFEWMPDGEGGIVKREPSEPAANVSKKKKKQQNKKPMEGGNEVEDDDMNADPEKLTVTRNNTVVEELINASRRSRKTKSSVYLEALERKKPRFDPSVHESFQQYFDEYYQLDFEDLVGDLPCRFKYHNVVANDFGLSTDEILKAPDNELNQWASVKKTVQYRPQEEELYDVQAYRQKGANIARKKRILTSFYNPVPEGQEDTDDNNDQPTSSETKKKRKKRKKNKKGSNPTNVEDSNGIEAEELANVNEHEEEKNISAAVEKNQPENSSKTKSEKKKKKNRKSNGESTTGEISHSEDVLTSQLEKTIKSEDVDETAKEEMPENKNIIDSPSKKSKKKKKKSKGNNANESGIKLKDSVEGATKPVHTPESGEQNNVGKGKKFSKKKKNSNNNPHKDKPNVAVDDNRLLAYGINPKKYKKRLMYGGGASANKSKQ